MRLSANEIYPVTSPAESLRFSPLSTPAGPALQADIYVGGAGSHRPFAGAGAANSQNGLARGLRAPAGVDLSGFSGARQHLSEARAGLQSAVNDRRQVRTELRHLSNTLRLWPAGEAARAVSWTDRTGQRHVDVELSKSAARRVKAELKDMQACLDDDVRMHQDLVKSAQHDVDAAQRDFRAQIEFEANLSKMRHETLMSIIRNLR